MPKRKLRQLAVPTPMRGRPSKQVSRKKLNQQKVRLMDRRLPQGAVLETPARSQLRKIIGKDELERIEAQILSGKR